MANRHPWWMNECAAVINFIDCFVGIHCQQSRSSCGGGCTGGSTPGGCHYLRRVAACIDTFFSQYHVPSVCTFFCQRLMQFFGGKNSFSTEILCEHLLVLLWMFWEFFQHNTRLIYNCNRLIGNRIWQIKWYYLRAPTTTRSSLNCIQNLSNLAVCRCKQIWHGYQRVG